MADIKLLDCTLRDGGYVNSWQWGFGSARRIIQTLTRAGVDVVEVGFLRNVDGYDPDVTVCNTIEELNRLLPDESQRGHTMYSGMAMRSNYDISKLSPYDGHGIEIIRITAHDYDIKDGMDFARRIKELGYKVSINPINIMGYSDKDLLWIFEQVNEIHPWQFSIVDTFGSMRRRDLERIVSMADHNLAPDIRLALHLHENMALSFCLAQEFLDKHLRRDLAVDGSLMGMGRIPGNLPIELIADYMNEYFGGHYNIDDLMDAIQDHIAPIKGECAWGYTPAYFLSAKFNLHRNYAEHYLGKGDLTNRDINHILAAIAPDKKTVFDAAYADTLYTEYKNRRTDDTAALAALQAAFTGKTVRVLAPGASLATEAGRAAVAAAQAQSCCSGVTVASATGSGERAHWRAMSRPCWRHSSSASRSGRHLAFRLRDISNPASCRRVDRRSTAPPLQPCEPKALARLLRKRSPVISSTSPAIFGIITLFMVDVPTSTPFERKTLVRMSFLSLRATLKIFTATRGSTSVIPWAMASAIMRVLLDMVS